MTNIVTLNDKRYDADKNGQRGTSSRVITPAEFMGVISAQSQYS